MIEAHEGTQDGPVIHIQHANDDNTYYCRGRCGDTVIPVQGEVMPWHYRHTKKDDCSYLQAHRGEGWGPPPQA
jgi:hypothetical protein